MKQHCTTCAYLFMCAFIIGFFPSQLNGQNIDLELALLKSVSNPNQYSDYAVTIKLKNNSNTLATDLNVHIPLPNGVVYVGGNEPTASHGAFDTYGSEVWEIAALSPGTTAQLDIRYFLLANYAPVSYGQVIAANEPDVDSTPNNGTPPSVNEDDEANTLGLPPAAFPDLHVYNLNLQSSQVQTGNLLAFSFDLTNQGNAAVNENYTIKYWLSTDNLISSDDVEVQLPFFSSFAPGFTVPNILGAATLPASLSSGDYYLIVKADADEEITESDEGNNIIFLNFSVNAQAVVCTGDMLLGSQAEVDNFPNCTVIEGNLTIRPVPGSSGSSSDINDLSPLSSLTRVTGNIIIEDNDLLLNLNGLENLGSCNALYIGRNGYLNNIQALSGLNGKLLDLFIFENPLLQSLNGLNGITVVKNSVILDSNTDLQNLDGLSNLTTIEEGQLILNGNTSLTSIEGLGNLTEIGQDLIITNCDALEHLDGLQNINSLRVFHLGFNDVLQDVSAMAALTNVDNILYVGFNPLLNDCCIFFDLLNNNGVGGLISFEVNGGLCSTTADILNNCLQPNEVDLSLAMTTGNPNPPIYTNNEITLVITNEGTQTANGIVVEFPRPSGTVYSGGNEWSATQGIFKPYGNEEWKIASLAAGESASITVSYFLMTADALVSYAQVIAQNETDTDSTPGNGTPPSVNEDDEATIQLNNFQNGNGSTSFQAKLHRQRLAFDRIYPNPAAHWVTLEIYSKIEQTVVLDFYNTNGQIIHQLESEMKPGKNIIEVNVSDWRSGAYTVIGFGKGHPAYGRFLKVWEGR